MTQEQFDNLLEQLESYKRDLDFSEREKEEYLDGIIFYIQNNEDHIVDEEVTLEEIFDELREQIDWSDGGYRDSMFPDGNDDDEEYPDGYDSCDDEEYSIHLELLDELQEYLEKNEELF